MHFKKISQYWSLKKKHSKIAPSKNVYQKRISNCPLKTSSSKNASQNCYNLSIGNKNQNPVDLKALDM